MITELQPGHQVMAYECAYCRRAGEVEAPVDCTQDILDKFAALVTCNPCVASMTDRRWLEGRIGGLLRPLIMGAHLSPCGRQDIVNQVEAEASRYIQFLCRLHGITMDCDPMLAATLCENSERWMEILRTFERAIRIAPPAQPEMFNNP